MSAAVLRDLAHLEVGLRNVYDRALNAAVIGGGRWTSTPHVFFAPLRRRAADGAAYDANDKPRQQIRAAIRAAGGPAAAPGKVIDVDVPVGRLNALRNRVAHHEPLLRTNLTDRRSDVVDLAGRISPASQRTWRPRARGSLWQANAHADHPGPDA